MSIIIELRPEHAGVFHVDSIPEQTFTLASRLLQYNHDRYHILWNEVRYLHNHQAHYLLTMLALGASPDQARQAFDSNVDYMRPISTSDGEKRKIIKMENFDESLGHEDLYAAWLVYFEDEISRKGWEETLNKDLFAGTKSADDLLGRTFEGALHPIIHLGFGIEFQQPAIIAEALAQAAIHPVQAGSFLLSAEALARDKLPLSSDQRLVDLFVEARSNSSIISADCWKGGTFEQNGNLFEKMPPALIDLAASYKLTSPSQIVSAEEVMQMRIAEMINVAAWFTAAAQRPDKQAKIDFFYMHCVNCSIFLSAFAALPALTPETKVRLLEFKVRMDLVLYICQGAPELRTEEIVNYNPRQPEHNLQWPDIIDRAKKIPCDGHVVKLIRALNHGCVVSRGFENQKEARDAFPIKGEQMWLKIAHMVLDSTEDHPSVWDKWMRGPGFAKAWDVVPDRVVKSCVG